MLITENNRKHYVAIKSLSRLLSKQNSKHKERQHFCMNCLQGFREEHSRNEHIGYCKDNESVRIEMPHKRAIVEYSDGQFQFKVSFIMYADFKSILEPIQGLVWFRDIKGFESRNQISINVLAIEDRQIYICRKGGNYEKITNLMLITENNRKHYVAIKSLSRLLSKQNSKHKERQHFCMNCLQGFREEHSRNEHIGYCKDNESVRIEMPHKRAIVEYSDGQFQFKVSFIMYADFKSILTPIQGPGNNPRISTTRGVNLHT